jgi:hypothetical protein
MTNQTNMYAAINLKSLVHDAIVFISRLHGYIKNGVHIKEVISHCYTKCLL